MKKCMICVYILSIKYWEGSEVTSSSLLSEFNALHALLVESLAKLLRDVAASASIKYGQVACRVLELTLVKPSPPKT